MYKNFSCVFFHFVTKHACEERKTDGRKEGRKNGQNYDPQDLASIAASRGKNKEKLPTVITGYHKQNVPTQLVINWSNLLTNNALRNSKQKKIW